MALLNLVISCSSPPSVTPKNEMSRRQTEEYFVGSGVAQYFLSDIPQWANFSTAANCYRQVPIRYLDISHLRQSFSLDYVQALQFQYMFNRDFRKMKLENKTSFIPLKEEEELFYNVLEKVRANLGGLDIPTFNRVHMVWIDPVLSDPKILQRLVLLMKQEVMNQGHPVFVSLCLNADEMAVFLQKNGLEGRNIRFAASELYVSVDKNNIPITRMAVDFSVFFNPQQKLYFYIPKGSILPQEFGGTFQPANY
ncbi:MAG: hypothetical protein WCG27_11885 [Pseudomonadota bacterium]